MSDASDYQPLYPPIFNQTAMDIPDAPNVAFSFVIKAPKAYVMDAWNLHARDGGPIEPLTSGTPGDDGGWPGAADNMERIISVNGVKVTQVVGNIRTPADGDWHFEWKAGAPYYRMPFPFSLIMKAVHGTATLKDGPGENQTTVHIVNTHRPGIALWFTRFAIKAAMPGLAAAAPKRFARNVFVGPRSDEADG